LPLLLKYRFPLAPDRPAAASMGRLLRTGRTSLRTEDDFAIGFAVLAVEVRFVHVVADVLPLRWAPFPLVEREEDPVERAPLPLRDGACAPLCVPFFVAGQRGVDDAERALLFARPEDGRASELRRSDRPLEADDADLLAAEDLRSWPFDDECLKCGRAELDDPLLEPLPDPWLAPFLAAWLDPLLAACPDPLPFPFEAPFTKGRRIGWRGPWFSSAAGCSTGAGGAGGCETTGGLNER
jgi:hypothetical protein